MELIIFTGQALQITLYKTLEVFHLYTSPRTFAVANLEESQTNSLINLLLQFHKIRY